MSIEYDVHQAYRKQLEREVARDRLANQVKKQNRRQMNLNVKQVMQAFAAMMVRPAAEEKSLTTITGTFARVERG